jgi:NTP pyrophosphatase (non-canonical NTP hydrolase)
MGYPEELCTTTAVNVVFEMGDDTPTLDELISLIRDFVQERNWEQYNKPAALAVSASIEMGELLELFQWMSDEDAIRAIEDKEFKSALAGEIADVMVYLLRICDKAAIDPSKAIVEKMKQNSEKYPVDEWEGKAPCKLNRS